MITFTRQGRGDLDENGQAHIDLEVRFDVLEQDDRKKLEGLIEAWYVVGFNGGYERTMLHQLQDVTIADDTLRVRLVAGGDCGGALQVLARCLGEMHEQGWTRVRSARTNERPYS